MKTRDTLKDKLAEQDGPVAHGHEAWKRTKVERALAQAQDRDRLIPLDRILRDFDLEG